jgi:predicted metal-dependent phosphoesterase TrpH
MIQNGKKDSSHASAEQSIQMNEERQKISDYESRMVELHCHSTMSDGRMPPEELAKKLYTLKVSYAALTDHDTVEGLPSFRQALMQYGIGFVSGLEMTTNHEGKRVHILAYGFDPENTELLQSLDEIKRHNDPSIPKPYPTSAAAILQIHHAGGISILAHPFQTEPDLVRLGVLLDELQGFGLDGMEAIYGDDPLSTRTELIKMAKDRNLILSAGTDFHSTEMQTPGISMPLEQWKMFRDALLKAYRNPIKKPTQMEMKTSTHERKPWFTFVFSYPHTGRPCHGFIHCRLVHCGIAVF